MFTVFKFFIHKRGASAHILTLTFSILDPVNSQGRAVFFSGEVKVFFLRSVERVHFFRGSYFWVDEEHPKSVVNHIECDLTAANRAFDITHNCVLRPLKHKAIATFHRKQGKRGKGVSGDL